MTRLIATGAGFVAAAAWWRALMLGMFAALPLLPLLGTGYDWPDTHEGGRYLILLQQFADALREGLPYPRWLPELYGGFGYPTFVFYPPAFFFAAAATTPLVPDLPTALKLTIYLLTLVGVIGAYRLGRLFGPPALALVCALALVLTPYLFVDLHVRGALAEFSALVLQPLPLLAMARLWRDAVERGGMRAMNVAGLGVSWAAVIFAHPITAALLGIVLGVFAVALLPTLAGRLRWRFLAACVAAAVIGLALSTPYWMVVLQLRGAVNLAAAGGGIFDPVNHLLQAGQLIARDWAFGDSQPGVGDGMSFQLGLPHLLLALGGTWFGRHHPLVRVAAVLYGVLMLSTLTLSEPLWRLPQLAMVQFPWRLLATIAVLQVLLVAGWSAWRPSPRTAVSVIAVGLLGAAWWYLPQFASPPHGLDVPPGGVQTWVERIKPNFENFAIRNEFNPLTSSRLPPAPRPAGQPRVLVSPGAFGRPADDDSPQRISYRVSSDDDFQVLIQQLYFPGWRVQLDGVEVDAAQLRDNLLRDGRMRLPVPTGEHRLVAYYAGPPGQPLRLAVLVALLLAGGLLWRWSIAPRIT